MSSSDSQKCQFSLRIERGRTRFPERLIDEERFLIGAGSNCHLQLGGEMPILHSIVVTTPEGLWIDSVVQTPQLLVNRLPVRECELVSGDVLEIGDFTFVIEEKFAMTESVPADDIENEQVDLRDLSAEDLVDLLQAEMTALEEHEASRVDGATALLNAAAELQQTALSDAGTQLLAETLAQRKTELDAREARLAEKAGHLQKAQQRLEEYIEQLASRVSKDQTGGDESFRKTA